MRKNWGSKARVLIGAVALMATASLVGCSSANKEEADAESVDQSVDENGNPISDAGTDVAPSEEGVEVADAPDSVPPPSEGISDAAVLDQLDSPTDTSASKSPTRSGGASTFVAGDGHDEYTVQGSDTLMKIAYESYGDLYQWKRIYEDNKDRITDPNAIPRGTRLRIARSAGTVAIDRNGEKYMIKSGDTLGTISDDVYGTTKKWKRLWENNKQLIHDPNKIYAGFFLYYLMTEEDRQEKDRLRSQPQQLSSAPTPAATALSRMPASVVAPAKEAIKSVAQGAVPMPAFPAFPAAKK